MFSLLIKQTNVERRHIGANFKPSTLVLEIQICYNNPNKHNNTIHDIHKDTQERFH